MHYTSSAANLNLHPSLVRSSPTCAGSSLFFRLPFLWRLPYRCMPVASHRMAHALFGSYGGGDTARFEVLLLKMIGSSTAGLRPSLLNRQELEEAQALAIKLNAPMGVYIYFFFYQAALDSHEYDQAEIHLHEYIEQADSIPQGIRESVWVEAAFFYAFVRKDLTRATEYFNQYKPSALIQLGMVYTTQAAIAILKNEWTEAGAWIDKAMKELPNMMDRGIALVLNEKLQGMKEQISQLSA